MIGIYSITNLIDGKRYIGKSINLNSRLSSHKCSLRKNVRNKDTNRYLFNAVKKYGIENFNFEVIECVLDLDQEYLADREIYWMDYYKSYEKDFGYNLIKESVYGRILSEDTIKLKSEMSLGELNPNFNNKWSDEQKQRASEIQKERHEKGFYGDDWKKKLSITSSNIWKDEDKKKIMAEKVAKAKLTFKFKQYDKQGNFVAEYTSIDDVIVKNPTFKKSCVYNVANGYKKSYNGFVFIKEKINE